MNSAYHSTLIITVLLISTNHCIFPSHKPAIEAIIFHFQVFTAIHSFQINLFNTQTNFHELWLHFYVKFPLVIQSNLIMLHVLLHNTYKYAHMSIIYPPIHVLTHSKFLFQPIIRHFSMLNPRLPAYI